MRLLTKKEKKEYEQFIHFVVPMEKIWIVPTKPPKDFEVIIDNRDLK